MKTLSLVIYAVVKWTVVLAMIYVIGFGLLSTYDGVVGDGNIPNPTFVGINTTESKLVNLTPMVCLTEGATEEECWEGLGDALVLMDKVVPHVARWVRGQRDCGRLVFDVGEHSRWAYYDVLTGKLHVSRWLLSKSNGYKCSVLSHEWRHSRQNYGKWGRRLMAAMVGVDNEDIIENDAYMYQFLVEKEMQEPFFTNRD